MSFIHRPLFSEAPSRRLRGVTLSATDDVQTHRDKLARIVLDEMYQFVGLLDADGLTLEINRAALEGAALSLDDVRGKPFWEARWWAVSPETVAVTREQVRRAGQGEFIRCDVEVFGQAAGEETIVIDFSLLPVRDQDGRIVFVLAEGRNITEKKRAEAEIARKNQELQNLLDRLRQADQQKSDFFANISHELRTPLALILGPLEGLLAGGADNLTPLQRRDLAVVQRNAATLLGHVNDLLDLAKFDAGKLAASLARVDLAPALRRVAEQFHALAPRRQVQYVVAMPERLDAEVDLPKLERVLLNLLSNAFKFTQPGGRIRCALDDLGERFVLSVQDSGPGVPPELRQAVFERFSQAAGSTRRDVPGTGLGLAIAKDFVELHHGTIVVSEAPGGGALFQVEIARHAPPGEYVREAEPADAAWPAPTLDLPEATAEPGDPAEPAARDGRPLLLVVEDNPDMRRFVTDVLTGDYRMVTAVDGEQALALALAEPPDLVITDLMLPRLGGDQLVAAMRATAALAAVPVLVLSARGNEALRARLLAEAVQDYVTKPFSAHELRARARNLVTMKRARDVLQRELASQSADLSELSSALAANRQALQRNLEALLESEHRWRALFEHSPVGIGLVADDGRLRASNAAFQAMLGYSRDGLYRAPLHSLVPDDESAALRERLAQWAAGTVREYQQQRRFRHRDGRAVWANTSVAVVPAAGATPRMLVVVAEDITERRRAAEALAQAQHELARVARVSTLGELAASIAHEVNQPLAAVVTNANACLRWLDAQPPDPQEAEAAVQRIVRDANRASDVIARIRGFLRRDTPAPAAVSVDAVVAEVLDLVREDPRARAVAIAHTPTPGLPRAWVDRVQLQQVVLNLVINALEALAPLDGRPRRLTVSVHNLPADGQLRVAVRDNGPGIAAADADRIFDAFHTTKPGGMGMGLAIGRSIVEAHGGRLWAQPQDEGGGCLCFTLPWAPP